MGVQVVDCDGTRFGHSIVMIVSRCRTCGAGRRGTFEVVGAEVAQSGMAASGVVPALDEFEDRHACFGLGAKRAPVDELAFERPCAHRCALRRHRQCARADLEALVETSPVGVAVFDAKTGKPVSLNREAKRTLPTGRPERLRCRVRRSDQRIVQLIAKCGGPK